MKYVCHHLESCDIQVTGSHDYSLRLWERTEEPLILSEEREKVTPSHPHTYHTYHISHLLYFCQEREALFEAAVAEGGETIVSTHTHTHTPTTIMTRTRTAPQVPGEGVGDEVSMAGRKTMESMRSVSHVTVM